MVEALKGLPTQPLPSSCGTESLLNGLDNINHRVSTLLGDH
jgi:hypothetical protein